MSPSPPGGDRESVYGVHVAIVRDVEDPEGIGRVKLEYPWRESTARSSWARIAVPMAGADRGTYFVPEPGDEVLVAFASGDIDHPFVVGGLWNGEDGPPVDDPDGDNDLRRITSRNGHELTFDDGDDGGSITIETASGHRIHVDDTSGEEAITIADTGGNEVHLDGTTGDLDISSSGTISIDATMLELSSSGNVDIDAGGILSLTGTMINLN